MMKILITALFSLITFQVSVAQGVDKNIHMGLSLNPQLSFVNFNSSRVVENDPSISLGLSGDLYLDIRPGLQFRTGLSFQRFSLKHRDYSPIFPADVMNGELDIYKSYLDFNSTYHFAGLPVEVKLSMSEKPNHLFFAGGLHLRYKINSAGYVDLNESGLAITKFDPDDIPIQIQKLQTFLAAHIGHEWKFNSNKLSAGPSFEYSLVNIFEENNTAIENGHLSFVGIRISYH